MQITWTQWTNPRNKTTCSQPLQTEMETGPVTDAKTTTSPSEKFATSATCLNKRVQELLLRKVNKLLFNNNGLFNSNNQCSTHKCSQLCNNKCIKSCKHRCSTHNNNTEHFSKRSDKSPLTYMSSNNLKWFNRVRSSKHTFFNFIHFFILCLHFDRNW